jgi:hypothetical protein
MPNNPTASSAGPTQTGADPEIQRIALARKLVSEILTFTNSATAMIKDPAMRQEAQASLVGKVLSSLHVGCIAPFTSSPKDVTFVLMGWEVQIHQDILMSMNFRFGGFQPTKRKTN